MPISYRDLTTGFHELGLDPNTPVIVHPPARIPGESPGSAFKDPLEGVRGGVDTFLGALLFSYKSVIMPAFTFQTMVVPEVGPPDNGLVYGSARERNLAAKFFRQGLPVDPYLGVVAESLRLHPQSERSDHPLLSFCGINARQFLDAQTIADPLAPVGALEREDGWVILVNTDHTLNTSIHWAEKLAGRRQFVRWALRPDEVVECPSIPGCSFGFNALAPRLELVVHRAILGDIQLQAFPLKSLVAIARHWIESDPNALLCTREECACCQVLRRSD